MFIWSNFNFLHSSQWITFPTQSCLVLYSFRINLLHSLIIISFFATFSQQVIHEKQSDSKCSQVFRTFLSILANFSNTNVWMVKSRHPFSNSSTPFPSLRRPFRALQLQWVSPLFLCYTVFLFLRQGLCIRVSFRVLLFSISGPPGRQIIFFMLINTRSVHLADVN